MADKKHGIDSLMKYSLERPKCIKEANGKFLRLDYASNQVAALLHPVSIQTQVKEIRVESSDVKTFVLTSEQELPNFQEGQYITIEVSIQGVIYQRPYTISCSSKHIKNQEIQITIQRNPQGIVSNYFFSEVHIGDYFVIHGPYGNFTYQSLRDSNEVLAIAGGTGIIPFVAMAEAICDGILDFHLTILYGAKREEDFIFKTTLDQFAKNNSKVSVVYLLSEEQKEGYLSGFINQNVISSYQKENMSYFVCGSHALYEAMNSIFKEMNIANKYIRHDCYDEYEKGVSENTFEIRVLTGNQEKIVFGKGNETILHTLEREGIIAPKRCGVGVCGICRSKLLEGEVLTNHKYVRLADQKYRYIHPCSSYPVSNLKIKLPK